jgi:methionine biosynthesis protein MetW
MSAVRKEHEVIAGLITPGSSVLDLGCGEGELMAYLVERLQVKVRGVEIAEPAIYSCVGRGLSVSHQDIDNGLAEYGNRSFDFVILNQCLQQVKSPQTVLAEAVRVGTKAIVGVSNFAHISARWQLSVEGRAPVTPALPFQWYDSPNLHFLSLSDFRNYCREHNILVEKVLCLNRESKVRLLPNMFAQTGIFLISKSK